MNWFTTVWHLTPHPLSLSCRDVPLTLEDSARLVGGHCWVERRLFEIAGGWVRTTPETEVKLMLDRHSQHHAWRARQWWDRLPVLDDLDREGLVVQPTPAVGAVMAELAKLTEHDGTVTRLAALYRVAVARVHVAYRNHRNLASEVADSSILRTLEIVGSDVIRDCTEGEAALQSLLITPESVDAAASTVARLELLLSKAA